MPGLAIDNPMQRDNRRTEMSENVKVIARCRPLNGRERDLRCKCVVQIDPAHSMCSLINPSDPSAPPKTFTFDGVYGVDSTTEQIYNEIVSPLVEGVLEGYNATVFAYGQTGCGKSFTMQGVRSPPSQRGVVARAFEHVFEAVSIDESRRFLVLASFLEIYNEDIRDLLGGDGRPLELRESAEKGVYVHELSHHPVQNVSDCEKLMEKGWRQRSTGATLMNADSSRSHCIFSVALEMMSADDADGKNSDGSKDEDSAHIRRGKLNLVDLAGSERQAKTGATGERLREATKINLSLSALGNVISALVDGRSKHIPYRDSKLTRLLQDSLGGNTKTLMIACLSPADNNYDESLSTLRYANRAKNISNRPKINEDPKDAMLRQYQEEIKQLRALLSDPSIAARTAAAAAGASNLFNASIEGNLAERERAKVRAEFEKEMARLREEKRAEEVGRAQLQVDLSRLKEEYEEQLARINEQTRSDSTVITLPSQNGVENGTVNGIVENGTINSIKAETAAINSAQQKVLKRLHKLQNNLVGGERAGDAALQERRIRRRKAAEQRLQALCNVLSKVDDDGVLKVYDDIQDELRAKSDALRKTKQKVRALEREISDLQGEFETERTDYLETIRKQERQIQFQRQVLEKIIPTLRKECNYSNIELIKKQATWSQDEEQWILPDFSIARTKLPPAVASDWCSLVNAATEQANLNHSIGHHSNSSSDKSSSSPASDRLSSAGSDGEGNAVFLRRLGRGQAEDIAGNYFIKPRRADELLHRAQQDTSGHVGHAFSTWKDFTNRQRAENRLNRFGGINLHASLGALPTTTVSSSSIGNNSGGQLNNSWGSPQTTGSGWIVSLQGERRELAFKSMYSMTTRALWWQTATSAFPVFPTNERPFLPQPIRSS